MQLRPQHRRIYMYSEIAAAHSKYIIVRRSYLFSPKKMKILLLLCRADMRWSIRVSAKYLFIQVVYVVRSEWNRNDTTGMEWNGSKKSSHMSHIIPHHITSHHIARQSTSQRAVHPFVLADRPNRRKR